jgi:uncharacterized protein YndB with AHSA1/START domain
MTDEIKKTIVIEAPPSAVFRALTDEKALTEWFPNQARLEARVGGQVEFKFEKADGDVDHVVVGKILEIIPDKKLSFSWKNTTDPDFPDTVVTWTLAGVDGKTRVELTHTGFEKGSRWLDLHYGGWSYFAGRLAEYCKNGHVESRAMYKELSSNEIKKTIVVDAPPQAVFKALTDEQELTQWFPNQAKMEARVGGSVEFRFIRPDGENHMLYGRVLEMIPDKKLSYTWNFAHRDQVQETVTWTLEPVDGGSKTKVTLVHAGFQKPSQKDIESGYTYESGWAYFIGRLEELFKKKKK